MAEQDFARQLAIWLASDSTRLRALQLAHLVAIEFGLGDYLLAAGFVRNFVWDRLHGFQSSPLADIDLIYFDANNLSSQRDEQIEAALRCLAPDLPWSVKNQARMHHKNADRPYKDLFDAMGHWPERETAVGVRLAPGVTASLPESVTGQGLWRVDKFQIQATFGLTSLFSLQLTVNPPKASQFAHRLATKGWLDHYPKLTVLN